MILEIKVIPGAKHNSIKKEGEYFKIHLTAPAHENKANKALIDFWAGYLNIRKNQIEIIKGLKSRNKTININGIVRLPDDPSLF